MITWKRTLIVFFSVMTTQVFPQSYNYRNFNTEEGLAQSYIYSIVQDVNGYLWIGTGNGLSKYNGFTFENFTTSDSLADNFITCSISNGKCLWFGHMNGMLSYYDGKKFYAVRMPKANEGRITHFARSPDDRIWVSTYSEGLLKLGKDTGEIVRYLFKDQIFIITFDFLDNNELLVGTNSGLLYCRLTASGEIEMIRPVTEIPGSKVTCIQKRRDKPGYFIATENDGIYQLIPEERQFKVSKVVSDPENDFTGIQEIYEDRRSDLWLGSFGSGLIKISHSTSGAIERIQYFNAEDGFISDNVKTVFEDLEGNIWSGNYGEGLTLITPKTFAVNTFDKQIYGNDIFSICITTQNRWVGTDKGLLKLDHSTGEIIKFFSTGSGLPKDTVTSIYSQDGKGLWIGTERNGLFRIIEGNEEILKYPFVEGALENSVNTITGNGDNLWIGTKKGLCHINSGTGKMTWFTISQGGLPHNYINCLYIDRAGKIWVTTRSNILVYIQDDKVFKISLNSANRIFTLGPVTEDTNSRIWVGSNGNGVFMVESDSITNLTAKEGLLSNYCYSLICDNSNYIWAGHKGGLSRIRLSDFSVKPVQHIENITESYQFNSNAIAKDSEEKIWFGSDRGLVSYDPSMEQPKFVPPVLKVTSIWINDIEKDYTDKIVLAPGKHKIRIDFLGISLKEPALVTYQYRLEGYDQWSEIGKNTSVTYNLTEGNYTFILKASSGDGAVTENPVILSIIIKTSVWKKWWFYTTIVFLLITLTFIYIKRREYRFTTEKKILEGKVLERTAEIQFQKDEIELQRDEINAKNDSITSSIRYASHIQNSILPPLELINKLLPSNFILSIPKDIVSGDFYWLAEKDNKIVFTVADCTGHGVPGAFMSFLGITLLNSLVNIQGITRSDEIVTKLRERVSHSLQQGRKDIPTTDGMDIALCVMDPNEKKIQFSGGMNNLVYIRDGKIEVLKADRFSVCAADENPGPFTMQEIDFMKGDVFYLFSDGYKDQFGGNYDKKYLVPHFYLTLMEIHRLPMAAQKEILEKKLNEWMKGGIQTDDVTVMGIRM